MTGLGSRQEDRSALRLRRWLPLLGLAAAIAAFFALRLDRYLTFETLAQNCDALQAQAQRLGAVAVLLYIAAYIAITTLSVPGATLLTMAGGLMFGTTLGALAALLGATLGGTLVFLIARTSFGDVLERRAEPRIRKLEAGFRANAWSYLLVLRLVPLFPFWLVNLVAGSFGVSLRVFVLCSLFGMAPGALVYAGLGAGIDTVISAGGRPELGIIFEPHLLLPLLGLAALALLPVFLKARQHRAS